MMYLTISEQTLSRVLASDASSSAIELIVQNGSIPKPDWIQEFRKHVTENGALPVVKELTIFVFGYLGMVKDDLFREIFDVMNCLPNLETLRVHDTKGHISLGDFRIMLLQHLIADGNNKHPFLCDDAKRNLCELRYIVLRQRTIHIDLVIDTQFRTLEAVTFPCVPVANVFLRLFAPNVCSIRELKLSCDNFESIAVPNILNALICLESIRLEGFKWVGHGFEPVKAALIQKKRSLRVLGFRQCEFWGSGPTLSLKEMIYAMCSSIVTLEMIENEYLKDLEPDGRQNKESPKFVFESQSLNDYNSNIRNLSFAPVDNNTEYLFGLLESADTRIETLSLGFARFGDCVPWRIPAMNIPNWCRPKQLVLHMTSSSEECIDDAMTALAQNVHLLEIDVRCPNWEYKIRYKIKCICARNKVLSDAIPIFLWPHTFKALESLHQKHDVIFRQLMTCEHLRARKSCIKLIYEKNCCKELSV